MHAIQATCEPLQFVSPDTPLRDAATTMNRSSVSALLIIEGGRLVGILTDRDLVVRALAQDLPSNTSVETIMTPHVITMDGSEDLRHALPLFREHAIRHLPLTDAGQVVAMLTVDDLLVDVVADLGDLARQLIFGHSEAAAVPVPA